MVVKKTFCMEITVAYEEEKNYFAQVLNLLGIQNFIMGDVDCDLEAEYRATPDDFEAYDGFVGQAPIKIYSQDEEELESIKAAFLKALQITNYPFNPLNLSISEITDDWTKSWQNSFKPIKLLNTLLILPPWLKDQKAPSLKKIIINPGLAFGTGQHETTKLCLKALIKHKKFNSLLDVGMGSGILSIGADALGAQKITAIDIDKDCLPVAKANAKMNGAKNITFKIGVISSLPKTPYEVVVANIHAVPLKMIFDDILKRTQKGSYVILSGILKEEQKDFLAFLKTKQIKNVKVTKEGDWIACSFTVLS
jgi:ribosomal protein L11 methyltransferase